MNRVEQTGRINADGNYGMRLPAAAVAGGQVPAFSCYISDDREIWLAVTTRPTSSLDYTFCGLSTDNPPALVLVDGVPGWYAYLIAIW